MAKPEFRAVIKNGVLEILPFVEKKQNAGGGTDVIVHAPNISMINEFKQEILNRLAAGETVENLEVENE